MSRELDKSVDLILDWGDHKRADEVWRNDRIEGFCRSVEDSSGPEGESRRASDSCLVHQRYFLRQEHR